MLLAATAALLAIFGGTALGALTADMSVAITGPGTVAPGGQFSLSFTARNLGPERAQNARVSVTLTRGATTFVSLSGSNGWSCMTPAAGADVDSISCSIAQLVAPQAGEFTLVLRAKPGFTGSISAGARVTTTTADSNLANDTSQASVQVIPPGDLAVSLTGPAAAPANTAVTYEATVRNLGPSYASGARATVTMPRDLLIRSVSGFGMSCNFDDLIGEARCSGSLYVGQVARIEVTALVDRTAAGPLTSRASAFFVNDPNTGNNTASVTTPVTHPRADVALSVNAFDFAAPNGTINYAITVRNNGPDIAYGPGVTLAVPAQTTFVDLQGLSGGHCLQEGSGWECSGPSLAPGQSTDYYLTVRVGAGASGAVSFSGQATTLSTDPTPGNDIATKSTTVAEAADVGIEISGPASVEPGAEVAYEVTVTNHGPAAARDVSWFAEDYPGTFVSLTAPDSWECNPPDFGATSPAGCNLASMDSGTSGTFQLVAQIASDEAGPIKNVVTVSSLSDPNGANDDAELETAIGTPPPTPPSAPRALTATAGEGSVTLGWSAPASDGGSALTGYDVYIASASGSQGDTPVNATPLSPNATSYVATGLVNGEASYFTVRALNAVGRSDPSNEVSAVPWAPSSVAYDGGQLVASGFPLAASARVSGPPECVAGRIVTFALDLPPVLGGAAPFVLGTATTDATGRATVEVPTGDWLEGSYTIAATAAEATGCGAASGGAAVTVGSLGNSAGGSGWYTLAGSGRVTFGFDVRRTTGSTYTGTFRVTNDGRWRLRGSLTAYVRTSAGGTATGVGELSWWNPSLNNGRGDWQVARTDVPCTIEFTATGTNRKTTPGAFGVRIDYTPVAPQPSPLPTSAPQSLAGGGPVTAG